jgi:hypothetical protein
MHRGALECQKLTCPSTLLCSLTVGLSALSKHIAGRVRLTSYKSWNCVALFGEVPRGEKML